MVAALQKPIKHASHYNDWPNSQGFDCTYEAHEPVELKIEGQIPAYAAGTLFRTGMGPRQIIGRNNTYTVNHWFDQLGQIHRFRIHAPAKDTEAVRVTYNSRLVSDKLIERVKQTGKNDMVTFGKKYDPCKTFFRKIMSVFQPAAARDEPGDFAAGVTLSQNFPGLASDGKPAIGPHGPNTVTTLVEKTDATVCQVLNPETLEPTGIASQHTLHPDLKGPLSGAHSKSDPKTGDVYNYNLEFGRVGTYRVFKADASTGKTSILATFHHDAAYVHSIFLTENYVIVCVWNAYYTKGGLSVLWNQNLMEAMVSDNNKPCKWFVVDKTPPEQGGRGLVAIHESDPFFCFHTINAFEQPSSTEPNETEIVADLLAIEDIECLKRFYVEHLMSDSPTAQYTGQKGTNFQIPVYQRFTLPSIPKTGVSTSMTNRAITHPLLNNGTHQGIELPVLNPAYFTKPYRYTYGVQDTGLSTLFDGLAKLDVTTGEITRWSKHGHTSSEPIFVQDPQRAEKEDGGVLLSVVLDGVEGKSYLLLLDAEDMREIGKARVEGVCGFGFHGLFSAEGREVGGSNGGDF